MNGISVMDAKGLDSTRHAIGVCPQFDTGLWEFLSGKEHLQIFASLKGIPKTKRDQLVLKMLDEVKVCAILRNRGKYLILLNFITIINCS